MDKPIANAPSQVNVINPSGKLVSIPETQLNEALGYGYEMAGAEALTEYKNDKEFGHGAGNAAKAFAAGAARGLTFGGSDYVLTKSGLVDRNTLDQLKKRNPGLSLAGEITTIAGSLAFAPEALALKGAAKALKAAEATGDLVKIKEATDAFNLARSATQTLKASDALNPVYGLSKVGSKATAAALPAGEGLASLVANPETRALAHKVISQAAAHAVGSSIEGAAYGLGTSVTESALGDPKLISEGIMSHVGYSALMGGAFGSVIAGGLEGLKGIRGVGKDAVKVSSEVKAAATRDAIREETLNGLESQSSTSMEAQGMERFMPPQVADVTPHPHTTSVSSLEKVGQKVRESNLPMTLTELPKKAALVDAIQKLPDLEFPVILPQIQSLENKEAHDIMSTFLDLGTEDSKNLTNYLALQKADGVRKTHQTIEGIAQNRKLTDNVMDAGHSVVNPFKKKYLAEKEALAPSFKAFDKIAVRPLSDFSATVAPIESAIEGASQYLSVKEGKLVIAPFEDTMPFTKESYKAVRSLVKAANKEGITLGELRNVRDSMRDKLTQNSQDRAYAQIGRLQKTVMDYMETAVSEVTKDIKVRETFKRYKINESNLAKMEDILKGDIIDTYGKGKQVRLEDVLSNIFRDSVTTKTAKEVLGQEVFDEATANFLKKITKDVSDPSKNGFSSFKFSTALKGKDVELGIALADKKGVLERIKALTTYMQILPDAPSSNPSGTAKTLNKLGLIDSIKRLGDLLHPIDSVKKIGADYMDKLATKAEQERMTEVMQKMLKGQDVFDAESQAQAKMVKYSILGHLERMAQKVKNEVTQKSKQIFNFVDKNTDNLSGFGASKISPEEKKKKFEKLSNELQSLNNNPDVFIEKLDKATLSTFSTAPQITAGLSQSAAKATQFLASKLPVDQNPKPLSKPLTPSNADIAKFGRYYEILENPVRILSHVKTGTLTAEHLETLSVNYPKLLEHMRSEVLTHLTAHMSKKDNTIPYKTRLSLSAFLGSDLDRSLDPKFMLATQTALANMGQAQANAQAQTQMKSQGKMDQAGRMLTPMQAVSMRT